MCLKYLRANIYNNLVQYMYPDMFATNLLRACCDYECLNFGTTANFVYNRVRDIVLTAL